MNFAFDTNIYNSFIFNPISSCSYGWTGPHCSRCVPLPGCVHGTCQRPHECVCERGWGGANCDLDLDYCARRRPCQNGGICQPGRPCGPRQVCEYSCQCPAGFEGHDCERKVSAEEGEFGICLEAVMFCGF